MVIGKCFFLIYLRDLFEIWYCIEMVIVVIDVDVKCKLKDVKGILWYFYVCNKKKKINYIILIVFCVFVDYFLYVC